MKNNRVHSKAG